MRSTAPTVRDHCQENVIQSPGPGAQEGWLVSPPTTDPADEPGGSAHGGGIAGRDTTPSRPCDACSTDV